MRLRALLTTLLLAGGLAVPATAAAQGTNTTNPFSPGLPVAPATTPTASTPTVVPTTTSTTGGNSLGGGGVVAIAVGALVLLGGISLFIWRDARRRAPVRHAHGDLGIGARTGSKPRAKPRKLSPAERRRRKRGRAR
ncbi:MAG: hypothetical protein JO244_00550 [Solirubrobacterales bacterium]|nr:hypothetical protein [Solirubrobacterales bacterium]